MLGAGVSAEQAHGLVAMHVEHALAALASASTKKSLLAALAATIKTHEQERAAFISGELAVSFCSRAGA